MIAALGRLLLLSSVVLAVAGAVVGFAGGRKRTEAAHVWTKRLALAFCGAMALATGVMEYALLTHDFSVHYVAQVGSRATPTIITIVSLWSSLEGSILFWGAVLAAFLAAFIVRDADKHRDMAPYTIAAALVIGAFFAFLLAAPATPFGTVSPVPPDGPGPNPLLQNHPLMIVHPPMLYAGYVGMTIPFSMGVAALLRGRLGASFMRPIRQWMLIPWGFLTVGIVLGGWWAYEVLGWGGYWAWDPVENASFLPWLTASAFLHAAMLEERRGLLKGWTLALLLTTFCLTILGTFMTRSGVFNSVHSFTQSAIGPAFLGFLGVAMTVSVLLLALRAHRLVPEGEVQAPVSREGAFIVNNLLFALFTFAVLVGTVFPLLAEAVRGVKVSVGEPFFNALGVPIAVAIVFMMGIGPALPWGRASGREIGAALAMPGIAAACVSALAFGLGARDFWPLTTIAAASFASFVSLRDMVVPVRARLRLGGGVLAAAFGALRRGRRRYGGQVVHIGVAMAAVAIALSSSYRKTIEVVLQPGESMSLGGYEARFEGTRNVDEPHRRATIARFSVSSAGGAPFLLEPRMNHYARQMNPIGTPAVRSTPREDLYLSVMHIGDEGGAVGIKAFVNPAVPWLWVALFVMVSGTVLAAWPSRSRDAAVAPAEAAPA